MLENLLRFGICRAILPPSGTLFLKEYNLFVAGSEAGWHENRLLNKLLDNYNPLERPVANESDALNVTFGLTLQQIIDVVSGVCMMRNLLVFESVIRNT